MRFHFSAVREDSSAEVGEQNNSLKQLQNKLQRKTMPADERGCATHSSERLCLSSELNHLSKIAWIDRCHDVHHVGRLSSLSAIKKRKKETIYSHGKLNAIDTRMK